MGRGWHFLDDYASFVGIECSIMFILRSNDVDRFKLLRCNQLVFPFGEFNGDRAGVKTESELVQAVCKQYLCEKNFKKSSKDLTFTIFPSCSGAKIVLQVSLSSSKSIKLVVCLKKRIAVKSCDLNSDHRVMM